MKAHKLIFLILVVCIALALALFVALTVDTADAQEAQPDEIACWHGCPKPPLRPQLWLPNVQQYLPTWWDGDNSGDAAGGER